MQVECKWCDKLSNENFKHKFYMAWNLWEENTIPPPYNIFYDCLCGLHPNGTFSQDFQVRVRKLGLLLSLNFGCSNLPQINMNGKRNWSLNKKRNQSICNLSIIKKNIKLAFLICQVLRTICTKYK